MKANVYKYHHLVDGYALYSSAFYFSFFIITIVVEVEGEASVGSQQKSGKVALGNDKFLTLRVLRGKREAEKGFSNSSFSHCATRKSSSSTEYLFDILVEANNSRLRFATNIFS